MAALAGSNHADCIHRKLGFKSRLQLIGNKLGVLHWGVFKVQTECTPSTLQAYYEHVQSPSEHTSIVLQEHSDSEEHSDYNKSILCPHSKPTPSITWLLAEHTPISLCMFSKPALLQAASTSSRHSCDHNTHRHKLYGVLIVASKSHLSINSKMTGVPQ